jgi:hypothetical protein
MDSLKFESNTNKQNAITLASILISMILIIGFRNFDSTGLTNSLAGFLLGLLLLLIGISAYLMRGKQTITIDPQSKSILIENTNRFGTKNKLIPFNDIVDIGIGYLGRKSNFVSFYYLNLKLRSGKKYPLFSPGRFYEGGSDRSNMESRKLLIQEYISQSSGGQRTI